MDKMSDQSGSMTAPSSSCEAPMSSMPPLTMEAEGHELEATKNGKSYKYRDFSNVVPDTPADEEKAAAGFQDHGSIRVKKFPVKLYAILARKEFHDIITWMPHGRSWKVLKPNLFESTVMPLFFENSNYHSFNRLINAWSFRRMSSGPDRGSYYHELFLRGKPHLQNYMRRLPKTHKKLPMRRQDEPDFMAMDKSNPLPHLEETETPSTSFPSASAASSKAPPSAAAKRSKGQSKSDVDQASVPISELLKQLPSSQPRAPVVPGPRLGAAGGFPSLGLDGGLSDSSNMFGSSSNNMFGHNSSNILGGSSSLGDSFGSLFSQEEDPNAARQATMSAAMEPSMMAMPNQARSNGMGGDRMFQASGRGMMGASNDMMMGQQGGFMPMGSSSNGGGGNMDDLADLSLSIQQHQQQLNRLLQSNMQQMQMAGMSRPRRSRMNNNMQSRMPRGHTSNNNGDMGPPMTNLSMNNGMGNLADMMTPSAPMQQQQQRMNLIEPTPLQQQSLPPQQQLHHIPMTDNSQSSNFRNNMDGLDGMTGGVDPSLVMSGNMGNNNRMGMGANNNNIMGMWAM
mmetsp:Transcript_27977/g.65048  ORF Transcript_27977/g.65048 Transcript_27977/m.65048 type:complete len:567 (+) Transcript_27977:60-1760(+)